MEVPEWWGGRREEEREGKSRNGLRFKGRGGRRFYFPLF